MQHENQSVLKWLSNFDFPAITHNFPLPRIAKEANVVNFFPHLFGGSGIFLYLCDDFVRCSGMAQMIYWK